MKIGDQIQKLREKENLSREKLAQQLYITRQAVYKWENDLGYPDIQNLIHLSELFEISLDELIKGDHSFQKNIKVKGGTGLFSNRRLLSSLNYFSLFFAPVVFPIITIIAGTAEIKKHGKRALVSQLIPAPLYAVMILFLNLITTEQGYLVFEISGTIFVMLTLLGVAIWNVVQGIKVLRGQRNGNQ
ncbi:helix-turn-helix domain-containing protein [Salicibibacter cibarius]|uniref:Helix-turn-helix domain-containing protein n=1 Tax=Salicibibacter cibarius TaxID=2743000 RepID=A0A7T6Z385_9BACI|nr:helix-turn-helix domain-containing protein [Salicibibacter cibarius]QQK75882.1 helix-turn-helix domain-containing protein [Salicibibacter cibarius]